MQIGSTFNTLSLLLTLGALLLGAAGAYGTTTIFRGSRNEGLASLQAGAVTALQGSLEAQTNRADLLEKDLEASKRERDQQNLRITGLQSEIETLRQLVTSAAKVDKLTTLVEQQHQETLSAIAGRNGQP